MAEQQQDSFGQILAKFWKWARSHPKFSVSGAISGVVFVADHFGYFQQIDSAMNWLLGPGWFSQILDSPWFDVAMLTIAIFCFYRMGKAGLRQDRQIAEEMEQRAVEREAAKAAALRPIAKLIENSAEAVKLAGFNHSLDEINRRLSNYQDRVADAQVGKTKAPQTIERPYHDFDSALRAIEAQLSIESPKIAFPKAVYEKDGQTVDPANNEAYYGDVCACVDRLRKRATVIENKIARSHDEIAKSNAKLLGVT